MPSHAVSSRRSTLVPLTLGLALAAPLGAQAPVYGTDVNAAADSGRRRSPILFGSAYTAPAGSRGISFQQAVSTDHTRRTYSLFDSPSATYYRDQFASTMSAYWGVRDWLTLGGSIGFATTTNEIYSHNTSFPESPQRFFSRTHRTMGDVRASARARLYRSAGGGTQVAANVAIGALRSDGYPGGRTLDGSIGLALAQQLGPVALHLAPSVESSGGVAYVQLAGALVFPLLPRVSASLEGIATNQRPGGYAMPGTGPLFDVGGGLRVDLGRVDLDFGLRQSTTAVSGPNERGRLRAVFGTHVKF